MLIALAFPKMSPFTVLNFVSFLLFNPVIKITVKLSQMTTSHSIQIAPALGWTFKRKVMKGIFLAVRRRRLRSW